MSGTLSYWMRHLIFASLTLAPVLALADPITSVYTIQKPGAALIWRSPDAATDVFVFAFRQLAVQDGSTTKPGPRVAFSIARTTLVNGVPVRRQWYGNATIRANQLTTRPDLNTVRLDAAVTGFLLEPTGDGTLARRAVKGRLQIRWTATAPSVMTTTTLVQQTPGVIVTLQSAGPGRMGEASATLTVAALGTPLNLSGPGSILAPTNGLLTIVQR